MPVPIQSECRRFMPRIYAIDAEDLARQAAYADDAIEDDASEQL